MANGIGNCLGLAGQSQPIKQPIYDPVAWANELRRTYWFYDYMRERKFPLRFCAPPYLRPVEYTTAPLRRHTKQTAVRIKASRLDVITYGIKVVSVDWKSLLIHLKDGLQLHFHYGSKALKVDPTLVTPDLSAIGLKTFPDLTATYSRPKPSTKDSRQNRESGGAAEGLYHFAYGSRTGMIASTQHNT